MKRVVEVGQDAQDVVNAASAGDVVSFAHGVHVLPIQINSACIFIDKSISIEIPNGATLRIADNQSQLSQSVEIFNVYVAVPALDDMAARPQSTITNGVNKRIRISSIGTVDKFQVSKATQKDSAPTPSGTETAITGDWQSIGDGIEIKFENATGHAVGDEFWLGTGGKPCYVIRVGTGIQTAAIDGVTIYGGGTIDANNSSQVHANILAADISANILIDGRVSNTTISDVTLLNGERPIMAYGRNNGTHYEYGETDGEDFNVNGLMIESVKAVNCQGAILFGHPAKRGRQNLCSVVNSELQSYYGPCVEPNYRTQGWEVRGCMLKPPNGIPAVHTWRGGSHGVVSSCMVVDSPSSQILSTSTPHGWPTASNVSAANNITVTTTQVSPKVAPPAVPSQNTYATFIQSLNPLAHYPLDGPSAAVISAGGSSIAYNGTNHTAIDGVIQNPTFLECWLWVNQNVASTRVLFAHRDGGNVLIQLTMQNDTQLLLQWRNSQGGAVNSIAANLPSMTDRKMFLGFRWTNGEQKLYVDGVEVASGSSSITGNYASTKTTIGATHTTQYGIGAVGRIDEFTIFTTPQTEANRLAAFAMGS